MKTTRQHARTLQLFGRALNHELRSRLLDIIKEQGPITPTKLWIMLRIDQGKVSQHLAILRRQGFLITRRQGKHIFYSVNHQKLNLLENLYKLLTFDNHKNKAVEIEAAKAALH